MFSQISFGSESLKTDLYATPKLSIPGISAYYNDKYTINDLMTPTIDNVRIAYEIKDDYDNLDENPQILADYLASKLNQAKDILINKK